MTLLSKSNTRAMAGAYTALISPFRSGKLDEAALVAQVKRQISAGITGLVPVGTTGESPTLDFDEHERVIALTIQTAKESSGGKVGAGSVIVMAGVGGNATSEAVRLHRFAKDAGAHCGLSVNPYYNKPSQEGLYAHFMELSQRVPELPIVLYNIPGRTGITMSAATVARLREKANVIAIKEACGSLDMVSEIMSACDIPVLSGDDSLTLPMMSIGAIGVVSVATNAVPADIVQMTKLALEGKFAEAAKTHHRLFPFVKSLFADGNPVGVKFALSKLKLDSGEVRLPLVTASEAAQKQIISEMTKLGLIS